jgi:hypothetical protein
MKKLQTTTFIFLLFLITAISCKKSNTPTLTELEKLPAITQTGANTFGCLVNGKVYIPKGSDGTTKPNLRKIYDNFQGDTYLAIFTYRYIDNIFDGELYFSIHNLLSTGNYTTNQVTNSFIYGGKFFNNCGITGTDTTTYRNGVITVTKLDLSAGIISGLFNCKIKPTNCDTIRITEGRFDFKL